MDEQAAEALLDRLIGWGYVEEVDGQVRPTRRWIARLMAAAERINLLAQRSGLPAGDPLVLAVTQALADENLPLAEGAFRDAVVLLVVLERDRQPKDKSVQLEMGASLRDAPSRAEGAAFHFQLE